MYSCYYEILFIFGAIWRGLFLKDGYCCFGRADGEVGELLQQGLVQLCKSVRRHFVLSCSIEPAVSPNRLGLPKRLKPTFSPGWRNGANLREKRG